MTKMADSVVEYVRDAVHSGTMQPDEWYSVVQIASELGMSRSPVREGLLRLQEAGLVRFVKNRGFQIIRSGPADVAEIFAIRLGIEPAAAYRAAKFRTKEELSLIDDRVASMQRLAASGEEDEFFVHDRALHSLILETGNARRGEAVVDQLRNITRVLGHSTAGKSRSLSDILNEHGPIVEAIRNGDADRARQAMHHHLTTTGLLLLQQAWDQPTDAAVARPEAVELFWDRHVGGL